MSARSNRKSRFTRRSGDAGNPRRLPRGFKQVAVVVRDENGRPLAGARVKPFGFRVKGAHAADAHGWRKDVLGPKTAASTDREGRVSLRYAARGIPGSREPIGALCFTVTHPDYSPVALHDFPVDRPHSPIRMTRGITLEISGWHGEGHEPVTDLTVILSDGPTPAKAWARQENGVLTYHQLAPGGHLAQLMGRLPSGEILYSQNAPFIAERGKVSRLTLEMKPGIRLEGRLDDNARRPVKNGRVMLAVRPGEYPALNVIEDYYDHDRHYGGRNFWHSHRPLDAEGRFLFESVPPGEADLVVLGDGFAGKSEGQLSNRVQGRLVRGPVLAIPQTFPLQPPITRIEVRTEPTATLEFTAKTERGKPLADVRVALWPGAFRLQGVYGWRRNHSSEAPYREILRLPDLVFAGRTNRAGRLVLRNLPPEVEGVSVEAAKYQAPSRRGYEDRVIRATFAPGATNRLEVTLRRKGRQ